MAEQSEAKSAKRSFASKNQNLRYFDAKLRYALLASLRSVFLAKFKWTNNWSIYPQGLKKLNLKVVPRSSKRLVIDDRP